jgi:protein-S-isoprenylcysteine O-methyltransferase Ste14
MLAGSAMTVIGVQGVYLGCIAQILYDFTGDARRRLLRRFAYTPTVVASGLLFLGGVGLALPLVGSYVRHGLALPGDWGPPSYMAVTGLLFVVVSVATFVSTLLLHAAAKLANRCYGPSH